LAYEKLALLASTVIRCGADCSEIVQDDSGAREALFASWDAMASCGISRRRNSIPFRLIERLPRNSLPPLVDYVSQKILQERPYEIRSVVLK